jgi:hypothetical protein
MKPLRVERFGETVQGVRLRGDPKVLAEPESFRVSFPGGDVDVVRCDDGSYWVHVRVDSAEDVKEEAAEVAGVVTDARVDYRERPTSGQLASDTYGGDTTLHALSFSRPGPYHLAVRVAVARTRPPSAPRP